MKIQSKKVMQRVIEAGDVRELQKRLRGSSVFAGSKYARFRRQPKHRGMFRQGVE